MVLVMTRGNATVHVFIIVIRKAEVAVTVRKEAKNVTRRGKGS
jgi:hypothetical protein